MSSPATEGYADAVAAQAAAESEARFEKAISDQTKWIITTMVAVSIAVGSLFITVMIALVD